MCILHGLFVKFLTLPQLKTKLLFTFREFLGSRPLLSTMDVDIIRDVFVKESRTFPNRFVSENLETVLKQVTLHVPVKVNTFLFDACLFDVCLFHLNAVLQQAL